MLSKFTLRCIKYLIKGGEKLRISLFTWDDNTGQLHITKSKLTWFTVVLMQFYLFGQSLFEMRQLWTLAGDPDEPISNYMKLVMQWMTRSFGMIITIESIFYGENKAVFMNQIIMLDKKFRGKSNSVQKTLHYCVCSIIFLPWKFTLN